MTLESQVCSLELAKKLKELGVPQESLFWWNLKTKKVSRLPHRREHYSFLSEGSSEETGIRLYKNNSAYTVAELGEMLPELDGKFWYEHSDRVERFQNDEDTEADARAKLLIYLIQNGLLDVKTLTV